jgi:hypothetical protein
LGDRALQNLGRWLMANGLDGEQAALTVEQTWLFYSYVALPALQRRWPMGIAARTAENRPVVYLYIAPRARDIDLEHVVNSENFAKLQEAFARDFATPLADWVTMRLESFWTPVELMYWAFSLLDSLEKRFRAYATLQHLDYIGVFVDDLEAELRTIMEPDVVQLWLDTPNFLFDGRRPAEFLDDPLDRQLRGVITRAKFNLPAA